MGTVSGFEELEVWQLARKQANEIYLLYCKGEFLRDFELKNQVNAASGSVMDNIAEGFERSGNKELTNFLLIAKASNGEVRSQLYRASDRKYISKELFEEMLAKNKTLSSKITSFVNLLKHPNVKVFATNKRPTFNF